MTNGRGSPLRAAAVLFWIRLAIGAGKRYNGADHSILKRGSENAVCISADA